MLVETNFSAVETLSESVDGKKSWFVEGIFAQGAVVNRNRRVYPSAVLESSMNDYNENFIMKNRAVGEAEHPVTTKINLDRISHLIVPGSLNRQGDNYSAKAKVLNTPCGNLVAGLLEGGVQIGVSTRADGGVKKNSQGIMEVAPGLKMASIDIVFAPGEVNWTYTMFDRFLIGGAEPTTAPLKLTSIAPLYTDKPNDQKNLLDNRELGIINIGGEGTVIVDGKKYIFGF